MLTIFSRSKREGVLPGAGHNNGQLGRTTVVVKATAVEVAVRVEVGIFKNDEQNSVAFWTLSKVTIRLTSPQIFGLRCSSSGLAHSRGARRQKFSKLPSFMVVKLR